jgi:predicted Zn-dependent peptidase
VQYRQVRARQGCAQHRQRYAQFHHSGTLCYHYITMAYQKTTLKNGLRIITVPRSSSPSATAMVLVGVGRRHEPSELAGISHFIEHNVFKATKNRPRRNQVTEEIEGLGGVTNAATGHEYTFYWAKAAAPQIKKILDLVMDVSLNMTFPEKDLEIERGNVIEEINMYKDNPPQRLLMEYLDFVWDGHPVGANILGTKETVSKISRQQMLDFVHKNYSPERMVVVAAGGVDVGKINRQVSAFYEANLAILDRKNSVAETFEEFQEKPRIYLENDKTQQTHLCLGFKTFSRFDERRYALDLLNVILGQGLSSRLFKKIRDELGLAYYVGSENWEFLDTGLWFARAGVDTKRVQSAVRAILAEFKRLAVEEIDGRELRKGKEYLKGKTMLSVETSDELGSWYGFRELLKDELISPQEYNQRIEALSSSDLKKVAQDLLRNDRLNLGIVGPFEDKGEFGRLLRI